MDNIFTVYVLWSHNHGVESVHESQHAALQQRQTIRELDLLAYRGVQLNISEIELAVSHLEAKIRE